MLSTVLNSERAIQANTEIMRAFVRLCQILASNAQLARKLEALEKKYDAQFMRSEQTFFAWLDAVERFDPYDEDAVLGSIGAEGAVTGWRDPPDPLLRRAARRLTDRFGQALTRFAR